MNTIFKGNFNLATDPCLDDLFEVYLSLIYFLCYHPHLRHLLPTKEIVFFSISTFNQSMRKISLLQYQEAPYWTPYQHLNQQNKDEILDVYNWVLPWNRSLIFNLDFWLRVSWLNQGHLRWWNDSSDGWKSYFRKVQFYIFYFLEDRIFSGIFKRSFQVIQLIQYTT